MADDDTQDYDTVAAMADRLKLTGDERTRYIHRHMTGLGYRMEPSYVPRDDENDDDDDDEYLPRRKRQERDGRGGSRNRRTGNDDWYS